MCSYAWIDLRGGCALLSAQGRRPREPSASTGTSFGWRDDVELFTTLALVVRSYSHNRLWGFKRVCGSILGFLRERCAVLGRRSIWAVLRLVAAWQFGTGVLWASVACFVNCTLIRQHPCPRVACYCAFAAQSGGGWWLAGEGARCLSVRGTRTLFRDRAGRGSNPCPGFLPGRTRVTCSRVSHLRDFALLGSVSVTVVRWCLLFPPARASSSRQLCLGLASYGPVLRVSSIAH